MDILNRMGRLDKGGEIKMRIIRCMGCNIDNPKLISRDEDTYDDEGVLLVCDKCGNNAFEFYKK